MLPIFKTFFSELNHRKNDQKRKKYIILWEILGLYLYWSKILLLPVRAYTSYTPKQGSDTDPSQQKTVPGRRKLSVTVKMW